MIIRRVAVVLAFILCAICNSSYAQQAYDGECMIGATAHKVTFSKFGAVPIIDTLEIQKFAFGAGASSIASPEGELIISCSTHDIYDRAGDFMLDGIRVTQPKISTYDQGRSNWTQNSIILPMGNDKYYLFTTTMSDAAFDVWGNDASQFRFDMLTYHVVDMKENNGLGKVVKRNQILMQDAVLSHNRMTAVRHGNGRDWWLVKPHQTKHIFYLFLVTADGITGPYEKSVNLPDIRSQSGYDGQSVFNRSGNLYAYTTWAMEGVQVLNFDRCSGDFSPYYYFPIPNGDTTLLYDFPSGVAFSPNGSLLYANTGQFIYQMEVSNPSDTSIQLIQGNDMQLDSQAYFPLFSNINLGADNRLYINNLNGIRNEISYIDKPNERGVNCNFCARCLNVGNGNAKGLPNMPYYHLGKKEGSVCDTISSQSNWKQIKVYPNPVRGRLSFFIPTEYQEGLGFNIYDMTGKLVERKILSLGLNSIQLPLLAKGIYTYSITAGGEILQRDKLLIE